MAGKPTKLGIRGQNLRRVFFNVSGELFESNVEIYLSIPR